MSKKTFIFAVLFITVAGSTGFGTYLGISRSALADSSNLIQNPTLTADPSNTAIPQGWLFGANGVNDAQPVYPVAGPDASTTAAEVTITSSTSGFGDWFPGVPATVTPFATYHFSDSYSSNVPTIIEGDYTITGTSTSYITDIATLPATNGTWATASSTFEAPVGASSLTIFHLINSVGSLSFADPSLTEVAGPQEFPQGMVSLTFDDGTQTQYDTAFPMLKAAGLPATFYIISQSMIDAETIGTSTGDINDDYMTPGEVLALNQAGNEIGDHTVNHCDLVTGLCPDADVPNSPDPLSAMQEIDNASGTLHGIGAVPVDTFAYPYGSYNQAAENDLQQDGFIAARTVDRGYNLMDSNRYALQIQYVNASTTSDADFQNIVKPWIDTAIANHVWLILLFHQIESTSTIATTQDPDATTPVMLQDVLNYLKQQNVMVKTVHDAACMMNGSSSLPTCAKPVVYPTPTTPTSTVPTTPTSTTPVTPTSTTPGTPTSTIPVTPTSTTPGTPTSTPPVTPTSTPPVPGQPAYCVLQVSAQGLSGSNLASITITDKSNGTKQSRNMGNWFAPFIIPTGNPFTVTEKTTGNVKYSVEMSGSCSGSLSKDGVCTLTFTH